jgi:hypothetical protein
MEEIIHRNNTQERIEGHWNHQHMQITVTKASFTQVIMVKTKKENLKCTTH